MNGADDRRTAAIPSHRHMLWPALDAVRALGGSGRIEEIDAKAIEIGGFSEEQQALLHGEGPRTELEYRLAWARTLLGWMGALENSARGVWSLTDLGRTITPQEVDRLYAEQSAARLKARRERQAREEDREDGEDEARDWKTELLKALLDLPPDRFERLARRLLREAGFISVVVTGRSGDGGIDGIGVYRMSLLSFPMFFQCKRYRGSVRSSAVRDFRGAMAGRGDKGLIITTGTFTADAKRESAREGAPPVDLIDGDRLCDLLKEYNLGVRTAIRQVEDISVVPSDFDDV
jgi:restriction system protein